MARVRRPAAEWAALIDEWHASGMSLPAFCQRRGLNTGTMQGWVYKRTHKGAIERARGEACDADVLGEGPSAAAAFLPVRVVGAESGHEGTGRSGVEIVLGVGRRVVIEAGFDPETLRRVVAVLEGRTC
ncbi:MAG TPA: hypothetical protein VGG65_09045 [Thermoanaerobaculia bacterium]|jgi:hypothetical protein